MKQLITLLLVGIFLINNVPSNAQVLNVTNAEQQYDQWCWAGCSKTILDYYGFNTVQQCDIAEFVRTTATFHDFGDVACCISARQGCNYWNYNWGYAGSIQDILIHFGNLQNSGLGRALTLAEVSTEIQKNKLFVIRWGWSTGGGHFVVGHGVNGNNIYYMNPWFGEGLHIGTYDYMVSGKDSPGAATHTWTSTNKIKSNVLAAFEPEQANTMTISPNPFVNETVLRTYETFRDVDVTIYDSMGKVVRKLKNGSQEAITIQRNNLPAGVYFIKLSQANKITLTDKMIIID
ncbi:MAG TPA: T9SS type A sorting domain-containing protein [Saprospiraceae bacterium]|nr:T9SS type A sorting domain-containing protein [Saprospiraceae bacterium]